MAEMLQRIEELGAPVAAIDLVRAYLSRGVTLVTRDIRDSQRDRKRDMARERQRRKRQKDRENKANAEANDAAPASPPKRDRKRDASRQGRILSCDLLTPLSSNSEEKTSKEVGKKKGGDTRARGTRLSPDAQLSDVNRQFALAQGVRDPDALWVEFRDYWIGVPGQRGTKLDWDATWRNRVRAVSTPRGNGNGHRQQPANDLATALREAREYAASGDPGWVDVSQGRRESGH